MTTLESSPTVRAPTTAFSASVSSESHAGSARPSGRGGAAGGPADGNDPAGVTVGRTLGLAGCHARRGELTLTLELEEAAR